MLVYFASLLQGKLTRIAAEGVTRVRNTLTHPLRPRTLKFQAKELQVDPATISKVKGNKDSIEKKPGKAEKNKCTNYPNPATKLPNSHLSHNRNKAPT